MKNMMQSVIVIVFLSFFFSGCEVGITALEQAGNEVNIVTTEAVDTEGNIISRIEIPESAGDVDVSVEIYGEDSKYFTVELTEKLGRYDSLITENPNNSPFYQNTTFHFFTRFILNGQNQCIGSVTKTIHRIEVAPVAKDQNVTMDEDTSILIELDASDKNEDRLKYIVKESPNHGSLGINEGNFTFTPDPNYFGFDSFTYVADDNNLSSNIATVNIVINEVIDEVENTNDAPIITGTADSHVNEDSPYNFTPVGSDEDNDTLTYSIVNKPIWASFDTATGVLIGTAHNEHVGTYHDINISVNDGSITTSLALFSITVENTNDAPIITLIGDSNITLLVGDTYNDAGAIAKDTEDGNIDVRNIETNNTVDTSVLGTYIVSYDVNDSKGTQANTVIRTVIVINRFKYTNTLGNQDNRIIGWLELVDLDRDGDLDILFEEEVSTNSGTTGDWNIKWYQNKGDGTYESKTVAQDTKSQAIHAADINGDGYNDIVYGLENIFYCINDKHGSFDCREESLSVRGITSIKSADIDGNGREDILFTAYEQNALLVLKQVGDIVFSLEVIDNNLSGAISIDVEDIDYDGDIDFVAVGETNDARVNQYINDGSGKFTKIRMSELGNMPASVSIADINDAGYADAIVSYNKGIHWLGGSLVLGFRTLVWVDENITKPPHASSVDINGDGSLDIVSNSNESNGEIVWYETRGFSILASPSFKKHTIDGNRNNVLITQGGDMDGDGDVDVVAGDKQGNIFIYQNRTSVNVMSVPSVELRNDFVRDNDQDTVEDSLTGLTWDDSDSVRSNEMNWTEAKEYCDSKQGNWRLPSVAELMTIVNKKITNNPKIQGNGEFKNIASNPVPFTANPKNIYWTSAEVDENLSWNVDFENGWDNNKGFSVIKSVNHFVRCVKGEPLTKSILIRDDNKEIVIDKQHGLEWQDLNTSDDSSVLSKNWYDVTNQECANSMHDGKDDWRLPTINELYFLSDRSKEETALPFAFKHYGENNVGGVKKINYWSSTRVDVTQNYFLLDFACGDDIKSLDTNIHFYRCVRDR